MSGRRLPLWIAVALVAVAALALGGCGGGDDAAEAGSTAGTSAPPATASSSFEAEDAVIALSDLPTGWAVDPEEDDDDDGFCGRDEDIPSLTGIEAVSKAEAQFAEGGDIPRLFHLVGAYAPGEAEISFAKPNPDIATLTRSTRVRQCLPERRLRVPGHAPKLLKCEADG